MSFYTKGSLDQIVLVCFEDPIISNLNYIYDDDAPEGPTERRGIGVSDILVGRAEFYRCFDMRACNL